MTEQSDDALARLLAPEDPDVFLERMQQGAPLCLAPTDRPRIDFDVTGLDRALESQRLTPGRIKVVKDGYFVPDASLLEPVAPRTAASSGAPRALRLNPTGISEALADGGTLVVNCVDELFPEVDAPLRALERRLDAYQANANLYATWGDHKGFDLHVDQHDGVIVQVSGAKAWYLFSPSTDVAALQRQPLEVVQRSTDLAQVVELRAGALLFLPRGTPHFAQPLADHSFHLTLTYPRPTLADFVRWTLGQPEAGAEVEQVLDRLGGASAAAALVARLHGAHGSTLVDRFFDEVREGARNRPEVRLFS